MSLSAVSVIAETWQTPTSCTRPQLRLLQPLPWTPTLLCSVFRQLQLLRLSCAAPCLPTFRINGLMSAELLAISSVARQHLASVNLQDNYGKAKRSTQRCALTQHLFGQAISWTRSRNVLFMASRLTRLNTAASDGSGVRLYLIQPKDSPSIPTLMPTAMFVLAARAALWRTMPTATVLRRALVGVAVLAMVSIAAG